MFVFRISSDILTVSVPMCLLSVNFDVEVESAWPSDVLTVK